MTTAMKRKNTTKSKQPIKQHQATKTNFKQNKKWEQQQQQKNHSYNNNDRKKQTTAKLIRTTKNPHNSQKTKQRTATKTWNKTKQQSQSNHNQKKNNKQKSILFLYQTLLSSVSQGNRRTSLDGASGGVWTCSVETNTSLENSQLLLICITLK